MNAATVTEQFWTVNFKRPLAAEVAEFKGVTWQHVAQECTKAQPARDWEWRVPSGALPSDREEQEAPEGDDGDARADEEEWGGFR